MPKTLLERRESLMALVESHFQRFAEDPEHEFVVIVAGTSLVNPEGLSGDIACEARISTIGNTVMHLLESDHDVKEYVVRAMAYALLAQGEVPEVLQ